ncbi:aspartate dehydrogenase [Sneathiella sp. P13V-1]|uniref:aspartate dehydrogenase n=1 Tax=Sneathiella sp. P13V-1 TaxID=2697366 RepID=UPI00187BAEA1|nr:aspartate dehydrogenase [Sneathiella sp. P13V-1]MBE7637742.1 aspartate dehydrogenase [Sneathiella sp. P13V-1]
MKIAIIGYGAIAAYAAKKISSLSGVEISHVICRAGREVVAADKIGGNCRAVTSFEGLANEVDIVVECGGHEAMKSHALEILKSGVNLISVSAGVMADDKVAEDLERACQVSGARLRFVTGAVGAMDALNAARVGGLEEVTYIGRKKPAGWKGSHAEKTLDLENLTEPALHFKGNAQDAARLYPKNANVAATIAMSGIGMRDTKVELYADPEAIRNIHEVRAKGAFGEFTFRIEGQSLPENPKSSALTAMSVAEAIERELRFIRTS